MLWKFVFSKMKLMNSVKGEGGRGFQLYHTIPLYFHITINFIRILSLILEVLFLENETITFWCSNVVQIKEDDDRINIFRHVISGRIILKFALKVLLWKLE